MRTLLAPLAAALLIACNQSMPEAAPATTSTPAAETTASAPTAPAAEVAAPPPSASPSPSASTGEEVLTEADFEDAAETAVSVDNMEDELAKIEKEIGASK